MPRELEIAVIDDDDSFRMALVDSLSSLGFGAEGYPSAEEYIRAEKVFDCVVTDIHLQGMTGLELLQRLAVEEPAIPVVLITAHTDIALEASAAAAGAACLLRKPFKVCDLVNVINQKLG